MLSNLEVSVNDIGSGLSRRLEGLLLKKSKVVAHYTHEMNIGTFYTVKWWGPKWAEKWLPWVY